MIPVMKWQDRMRRECRAQGITFEELARRTGLQSSRIRKYATGKGNQPRGDTLNRIARVLGVELFWLRDNTPPKHATPSEGDTLARVIVPSHTAGETARGKERPGFGGQRDVPVYKTTPTPDGTSALITAEISDLAERPPGIVGATGVYAVFARGESMSPKYDHGDIVYIHPDRPIMAGGYVLVGYKDSRVIIRRLISRGDSVVVLRRLNPLRDERHTPDSFEFIHHILSLNELVGL